MPTGLGQYVPVASPVHALDPVAKLSLTGALAASVFLVDGFAGLFAIFAIVLGVIALARIPARVAMRGVTSVSVLLAFTLGAHMFRIGDAPEGAIASVGWLHLSGPGLEQGLFFALRIVVLVIGTSLLTLSTSPVDLADGLERVMCPLARIGFPAHDVAMMLSVALRFIPATAEEAERIVTAQIARGARFDRGGPIRRGKAYLPVLVPLFVGLFRRADRLATAMESRCYRGGEGRSRLREARLVASDWIAIAVGCVVMAALAYVL